MRATTRNKKREDGRIGGFDHRDDGHDRRSLHFEASRRDAAGGGHSRRSRSSPSGKWYPAAGINNAGSGLVFLPPRLVSFRSRRRRRESSRVGSGTGDPPHGYGDRRPLPRDRAGGRIGTEGNTGGRRGRGVAAAGTGRGKKLRRSGGMGKPLSAPFSAAAGRRAERANP